MSLKIAHLSDPHFGTVYPETLNALYKSLDKLQPDLILLSGDISQRARYQEFKQAAEFVAKLAPIPVISIPGNHDIPLFNLFARFSTPYFGFRNAFKGVLQRHVSFDECQVIALNSTSRWRHIQGDFIIDNLRKRLKWFEDDEAGKKLRILVFHHPMDCREGVDLKNLLKGRDEAMHLFHSAKVDLILGGHIHDPFVSLSTQRYPQIPRAMVLAVGGTCLSWRTRAGAPNSFNFIEVEKVAKMKISRYDLNETGQFESVDENIFCKDDASGWQKECPDDSSFKSQVSQ